jgi:hypothetical protein
MKRFAPTTLPRLAIWLAVLCVFIFVLLLGQPHYTNASRPPWYGPDLGIQFARTPDDIGLILSDAPSLDREVMRIKVYIDYAFLTAYSALFVTLGLLAARGPMAWQKVAGIAAAVCGVAAGLFDVMENRAIFKLLDATLAQTTAPMIGAVHAAALAKWILLALTVLLLAAGFAPRLMARRAQPNS